MRKGNNSRNLYLLLKEPNIAIYMQRTDLHDKKSTGFTIFIFCIAEKRDLNP